MKTNEQIKMAQDLIKGLQDYVELARVEKKLKIEANKETTNKMIECITGVAKININSL